MTIVIVILHHKIMYMHDILYPYITMSLYMYTLMLRTVIEYKHCTCTLRVHTMSLYGDMYNKFNTSPS